MRAINLPRAGVLERIIRANPRIVTIVTGPGWGKSFLGKELARALPGSTVVEFRNARSAEAANARLTEALAARPQPPSGFLILDDIDELAAVDPEGTVLDELLSAAEKHGRIALLSRNAIPLDLTRYAAPHEVLSLKRQDLELTAQESLSALSASNEPREVVERALELSGGWAVATLFFSRLAREGRLREAVENPAGDLLRDLHEYVGAQTLSRLTKEQLAAMIAVAAVPSATCEDVSAALQQDAAPVLEGILSWRPLYLKRDGNAFTVRPLIAGALQALYPIQIRASLERAARAQGDARNYVRAAALASAAGIPALAAEFLDAAGPYRPGEVMSVDYYEVARSLPLELVCASKCVFLEFFTNQRVRSRPYVLAQRLERFVQSLTPDVDPFVRYSAQIGLLVAFNVSARTREAEVVARECIATAAAFPEAHDRQKLLMSEFSAVLATLGRVDQGRQMWEETNGNEAPAATKFYLQHARIAYFTLLQRGERVKVLELLEQYVGMSRRWNDGVALGFALAVRALAHFMLDATASIAGDLAHIADAVGIKDFLELSQNFGDPFEPPTMREREHPIQTSCILAIDAALAQSDPELALRLIEGAIGGFDEIGEPYWQIAGRLSGAIVPGAPRDQLLAEAEALADQIEVPELRNQIQSLRLGKERPGPYSAFMARLRNSVLSQGASALRVNVVKGTVTRGGAQIAVRQRELEVLAVLAMAGGPLSIEQICAQVWPEADPAAALSALRMSVHRLRKQLDDQSAVLNVTGGYQLSPNIAVDLSESEHVVAALRRLAALTEPDRMRLESIFQELATTAPLNERMPWYQTLERRLDDLRHAAANLIARDALANGQPLRALETAEALLRIDPLDEPAVETAVRALMAAGERGEASRRWRQYVRHLEDEYGTQPSVDLSELLTETALQTA